MKSADHPVAASKASVATLRGMSAECKVGKFTAKAHHESSFPRFQAVVLAAARDTLEGPVRLLVIRHLCNSIALRIPGLQPASRALVEGFVLELITLNHLMRLGTVGKSFEPYHVVY